MSSFWILSVIATVACLAGGFAAAGRWLEALLALIPAALWLFSRRKGLEWPAALGLVGIVVLAALGLGRGISAPLMVAGAAAGLVAWDLTVFSVSLPEDEPDRRQHEAQHLRRLLPPAGLGLALAEAGLLLRVQLPFGWLVVIALVILAGLVGAVRMVKRGGEG